RQHASHGRMDHRVERIGKKYQWIAFFELAGRLSDIAAIDESGFDIAQPYKGPWQIAVRDMDPTIVGAENPKPPSNSNASWWSPFEIRWRDQQPQQRADWMKDQERDIPDPRRQIDV